MKADTKSRPKSGSLKGEVYRQSRLWHGYLSAFAFLALTFFAITGLLLNHPEWTTAKGERPAAEQKLTLSAAELKSAQAAKEPGRAVATLVGKHIALLGEFQSGEVVDGQAMLRLEGVRGSSDIAVDMETGEAEVTVQKARLVDTLNDLHRGKNAGAAWKAIIDASAIVVLALSLIGYVLFFSLRFRLRTSLILTGLSLAGLLAVVLLLTP